VSGEETKKVFMPGLFFLGFVMTSNRFYSADMQDYGKIWTALTRGVHPRRDI
jgi:hypothetical protein